MAADCPQWGQSGAPGSNSRADEGEPPVYDQWVMRPAARHFLPLAALLVAGCGARPAAVDNGVTTSEETGAPSATALPTAPLRIATAAGPVRALTVEVAITAAQQEQGLMHRTALPEGRGMIFPFAWPRMASFWMKDTPLPLDLLFVRPDGTIAAVLPGRPNDLQPISAGEPVSAVVEIAGGSAAALGIAPGDHVRWGDCTVRTSQPGEISDPLRFCPAPPARR